MTNERYPVGLVVTESDFVSSGWEAVLAGVNRRSYPSLWQAFSDATRQAMDEERTSHGKVFLYWLMHARCRYHLRASMNHSSLTSILKDDDLLFPAIFRRPI